MLYFAFQPRMSTTPDVVQNYPISASTVSANQALVGASAVRIQNPTGAVAYINFGTKNCVATSSHIPVPNGQTEIFSVPAGAEYIAVLLASGTGTIHVTPGDGV